MIACIPGNQFNCKPDLMCSLLHQDQRLDKERLNADGSYDVFQHFRPVTNMSSLIKLCKDVSGDNLSLVVPKTGCRFGVQTADFDGTFSEDQASRRQTVDRYRHYSKTLRNL